MKRIIYISITVTIIALAYIFFFMDSYSCSGNYCPPERIPVSPNNCPIFYTPSQHGDINLPIGTIFGYPSKSGENVYDIIRDNTFIMSDYFREDFNRNFTCFDSEAEAQADGYKLKE